MQLHGQCPGALAGKSAAMLASSTEDLQPSDLSIWRQLTIYTFWVSEGRQQFKHMHKAMAG